MRQKLEIELCSGGGSPGYGEPVQPDGEDELEQQPGEEDRGRIGEDREDAQHGIRPAVAEVGGDLSQGDADDERHDQRVEGELEGGRPVGEENLRDRLAVGDRAAEVAGEDVAQVLDVLHQDRPVEAGVMDALGQLIGRQLAAQRDGDRVAGDPHQDEHHRHQDEDGGEDQQESDDQVAPERAAAAAARLRRRRRSAVAAAAPCGATWSSGSS